MQVDVDRSRGGGRRTDRLIASSRALAFIPRLDLFFAHSSLARKHSQTWVHMVA